jgi:hypothetical protein
MARRLLALLGASSVAALLALAASSPVLACQAPPRPTAEVAREVDRIVVGVVRSRTGDNPWTYEIAVERVIKGPDPGAVWTFSAGASDCGMPRLDPGQRVAIELYEPGRISPGAWFYAWWLEPAGIASEPFHAESPLSFSRLLALYAAVLPDTATAATAGDRGFGSAVVVVATATAGLLTVGWRLRTARSAVRG